MPAPAIPSFNPSSSAGGAFGSNANRSINIVGANLPDADSLNRLMAFANGPSGNGGFTANSGYEAGLVRTSDVNLNKWTPYLLIGGLTLAAFLLLRK
jgi:hypothetical protein